MPGRCEIRPDRRNRTAGPRKHINGTAGLAKVEHREEANQGNQPNPPAAISFTLHFDLGPLEECHGNLRANQRIDHIIRKRLFAVGCVENDLGLAYFLHTAFKVGANPACLHSGIKGR